MTAILGPEVDRPATLHTNARTDLELLAVWLKSHADGSEHTIRVYRRVGERFLGALSTNGASLRWATVEDVQAALEAMRSKDDGSAVKATTVNTYVAAVKSLLGFAHRVGFTRFNAAPLIKLKKALVSLPPNATDAQASEAFHPLVKDLISVSKCPDYIVNKGHYFGSNLSNDEKNALIEFLKTF